MKLNSSKHTLNHQENQFIMIIQNHWVIEIFIYPFVVLTFRWANHRKRIVGERATFHLVRQQERAVVAIGDYRVLRERGQVHSIAEHTLYCLASCHVVTRVGSFTKRLGVLISSISKKIYCRTRNLSFKSCLHRKFME